MTDKEVQLGKVRRVVLATDGKKIIVQYTELKLPALALMLQQAADGLRTHLEQSSKEERKDTRT